MSDRNRLYASGPVKTRDCFYSILLFIDELGELVEVRLNEAHRLTGEYRLVDFNRPTTQVEVLDDMPADPRGIIEESIPQADERAFIELDSGLFTALANRALGGFLVRGHVAAGDGVDVPVIRITVATSKLHEEPPPSVLSDTSCPHEHEKMAISVAVYFGSSLDPDAVSRIVENS